MCFYFKNTLDFCDIYSRRVPSIEYRLQKWCKMIRPYILRGKKKKISVETSLHFDKCSCLFLNLFNKPTWKLSILDYIGFKFLGVNPYASKMIQILHKIIQLFFMRSTRIRGILSLHQSKYTDIGSHLGIANTTLKVTSVKYAGFSNQ